VKKKPAPRTHAVSRSDRPTRSDAAAVAPARPKTDWLGVLARQIDSLIEQEPDVRSAGALVMRALVKEAVQGDVRAIRECLSLAEKATTNDLHHPTDVLERVERGSGRGAIDFDQVRRDGYRTMSLSQCAAAQGVPKQTALGPVHGSAFRQAWEEGMAQRAREAGELAVLVQQGKVKLGQAQGLILMATLNRVLRWNKTDPEEQVIETSANLSETLAEFLLRIAETTKLNDVSTGPDNV
jgi:hypothetical protein